jgi:hypothetical protein
MIVCVVWKKGRTTNYNSPFGHGWKIVRMVLYESLELRREYCVLFQVLHLRVRRVPQKAFPEPIENTRDVWIRSDYER